VKPFAQQDLRSYAGRASFRSTEWLARIKYVLGLCRYEHGHDPECYRTDTKQLSTQIFLEPFRVRSDLNSMSLGFNTSRLEMENVGSFNSIDTREPS